MMVNSYLTICFRIAQTFPIIIKRFCIAEVNSNKRFGASERKAEKPIAASLEFIVKVPSDTKA